MYNTYMYNQLIGHSSISHILMFSKFYLLHILGYSLE